MSATASAFIAPVVANTGILSNNTGSRAVLITNNNGVFVSTAYGASWIQSTAAPILPYTSVTGDVSLNNIFICSNNSQLCYYSSNLGVSWTLLSSMTTPLVVVSNQDSSNVYSTSNNNSLYVSTNLGTTWTNIYTLPSPGTAGSSYNYGRMVCDATGQYVYTSVPYSTGASVKLWLSTNFGVSFTDTNNNLQFGLFGPTPISCSSDGSSVSYMSSGGLPALRISSTYGSTFISVSVAPTSVNYYSNTNIIYTTATAAYYTTNFGVSSTTFSVTGLAFNYIANSTDSTYTYITDNRAGIYYSSDSGTSWALTNSFATNAIGFNSITSNVDGSYLYATGSNEFYISTNMGISWLASSTTPNAYFSASTDSSGQNVYSCVTGTASYIYKSTYYAINNSTIFALTATYSVNGVYNSYSGQYVYCVGNSRPTGSAKPTATNVYISSNYGTSFTTVTNIAFAFQPSRLICNKSSNTAIDGQYVVISTVNGFVNIYYRYSCCNYNVVE